MGLPYHGRKISCSLYLLMYIGWATMKLATIDGKDLSQLRNSFCDRQKKEYRWKKFEGVLDLW